MGNYDCSTFNIIPSVRRFGDLQRALKSEQQTILLTEADIVNLKDLVDMVHKAGKKAWINLELLGGFGRDQKGMKLLKNYYGVDGVMSTDSTKLTMTRRLGLTSLQRFFIVDSRALDTTMKILENSKVDGAEILPAHTAIQFINTLRENTDIPLLAGGFVETPEMIETIREAGFSGMTTSKSSLW